MVSTYSQVTETFESYYLKLLLRTTKTLIGIVGSVAVISLAGLYTFQSKLVYPAFAGDGHGVVDTPDMFGMDNYDSVDIETVDKEVIKLYIIKQSHNKTTTTKRNKTVMILCPNAGNMGHALPIAQLFYYNMRCNVILYSYRGYGKSTGSPSEKGLKLDADSVIEYFKRDEFLKNTDLYLHGRSLGGAVAIYIASKYPTLVKGLMLENTFLSIRKVIPYLFPYLSYFSNMCHQIWNSEELIQSIPSNIPVMFFSGLKDEIVPTDHMKKLFKLCKSTEKLFFEFPNGHHNDTIIQDNYWRHVSEFLDSN